MDITQNRIRNKIHLACSSDDLRFNLCHVYFHKQHAVATDANVLVRIDLREQLEEETLKHFEGKFLNTAQMELICNQIILTPVEKNVNGNTISIIHDKFGHIEIPFAKMEDRYPDYEAVIPAESTKQQVERIAYDPRNLKKIVDAIFPVKTHYAYKGIIMKFHGENRSIIIEPLQKSAVEYLGDSLGMLMPMMINNY